jgi:hypothetical protein
MRYILKFFFSKTFIWSERDEEALFKHFLMLPRTINPKCFCCEGKKRSGEEWQRAIDSIKTFSYHYTNSRDSSYEKNDIDVKIISYSRLASFTPFLFLVRKGKGKKGFFSLLFRYKVLNNQTYIQPANLFLLLPIYIQTWFWLDFIFLLPSKSLDGIIYTENPPHPPSPQARKNHKKIGSEDSIK